MPQIDLDPAVLDFTIHKGSTLGPIVFDCTDLDCNPVDLTGWSAYAHVRANASGSVVLNLSPTITGNSTGEITIEVANATTANISASAGLYLWDLVLQNTDGDRYTVAAGNVTLRHNITQP